MSIFGAHMSIAGGHQRAVEAAADLGFDCVQLFSKNSNQWKAKPISPEDAALFRETLLKRNISHPLIHDSYLINLGSAKEDLYEKSVEAFLDELRRAETLGVPYLVMHPGTPTGDASGDPVESGLKRIAAALDRVFEALEKDRPQRPDRTDVLLETTAGQGANLGWSFDHLARIIELSRHPDRLGVCVDTCHIHAAGYPIIEKQDYETTFASFDRVIGLNRLKAFHLNDSVKGLDCRVDRHAPIGHGTLGLEPFRHLLNDPRFREIPMYLETPKGTTEIDGVTLDWDAVNLKTLRSLILS